MQDQNVSTVRNEVPNNNTTPKEIIVEELYFTISTFILVGIIDLFLLSMC